MNEKAPYFTIKMHDRTYEVRDFDVVSSGLDIKVVRRDGAVGHPTHAETAFVLQEIAIHYLLSVRKRRGA